MKNKPSLPEPAVRDAAFEAELRLIWSRYAAYAGHPKACAIHRFAAAELGRK